MMPKFLFRVIIYLLYGLGIVFLYNGVIDLIHLHWDIAWASSIAIGICILVTLIFIFKFKWLVRF